MGCGGRRRTFRLAYAALAEHLRDEHFAALKSSHQKHGAGDQLLLRDRWPYRSSCGSLVHDELLRIEAAWARALTRGTQLERACRCADAPALRAVWEPAATQLFPFPTATMLCDAAANGLDAQTWRLLRRCNELCDARCAESGQLGALGAATREAADADSALRSQRDAIEGAGYGRTERRRGRRQRAAVIKFGWHAPSRSLSSRRRRRRSTGAALEETDAMPETMCAHGAGAAAPASSEGTSSPAMQRRTARRQVVQSAQAVKGVPPSERRAVGRVLDGAEAEDRHRARRAVVRLPSRSVRKHGGSAQTELPAPHRLPAPARNAGDAFNDVPEQHAAPDTLRTIIFHV